MPNIQPTKYGGIITWDSQDWLSGLHPQYSGVKGRKLGNYLSEEIGRAHV